MGETRPGDVDVGPALLLMSGRRRSRLELGSGSKDRDLPESEFVNRHSKMNPSMNCAALAVLFNLKDAR